MQRLANNAHSYISLDHQKPATAAAAVNSIRAILTLMKQLYCPFVISHISHLTRIEDTGEGVCDRQVRVRWPLVRRYANRVWHVVFAKNCKTQGNLSVQNPV